jgi:peptide methionine sulfoxide reductase msrA/msrB
MKLFLYALLLISPFLTACKGSKHPGSEASAKTLILLTDEEWKARLTPDQYAVLRQNETEPPFSGSLLYEKKAGTYHCAGCGQSLFASTNKFDAHCGWPSFDKELPQAGIQKKIDYSHGMVRTEIRCGQCDGHLGHLFDDGPTETGKRYCVNALSMSFAADQAAENRFSLKAVNPIKDTIVLGGGCFWCVEAVYEELNGVLDVQSGYAGGHTIAPTYEEVCDGQTGHAEVIQIIFDPGKCSLLDILEVFFSVHDPTTLNRQGADVGEQYRSVICYRTPAQRETAQSVIQQFNQEQIYDKPVVTQVIPLTTFYPATPDHQNYYQRNANKPYCQMVIQPKLEKFRKLFAEKRKATN